MGLKEEFVKYCEIQRAADELLRSKSPNENSVVEAFTAANNMKRSLLDKLEAVDENSNSK